MPNTSQISGSLAASTRLRPLSLPRLPVCLRYVSALRRRCEVALATRYRILDGQEPLRLASPGSNSALVASIRSKPRGLARVGEPVVCTRHDSPTHCQCPKWNAGVASRPRGRDLRAGEWSVQLEAKAALGARHPRPEYLTCPYEWPCPASQRQDLRDRGHGRRYHRRLTRPCLLQQPANPPKERWLEHASSGGPGCRDPAGAPRARDGTG